ncbi:MAG: hypothetical protein QW175_02665 [Candidatus Bathyarchaeia archaeon]
MRQASLRGKILHLLRRAINGLDKDGIVHVFYQYYKLSEIEEALRYLEDKGYIQSEDIKISPRLSYKFYRISAKGIDVLDGIVEEKGIVIPEEDF